MAHTERLSKEDLELIEEFKEEVEECRRLDLGVALELEAAEQFLKILEQLQR